MTPLTPEILLRAYAFGVFPMAEGRDQREVYWVDPKERGVLPLEDFHLPRRLARTVRQNRFQVRCDTGFDAVLEGCAAPGTGRPDTWINSEIRRLSLKLYEMGFAHSVECWQGERLVGGLYGVALGGAFFGESMFSRERDASKVALVHLMARLRRGSYGLLDTQFITKHLEQFGAIEIPRDDYRQLLSAALEIEGRFDAPIRMEDVERVMQGGSGGD